MEKIMMTKILSDLESELQEKIFHINLGIYMRKTRLALGMTQTEVAEKYKKPVTFQQVQKNEKGSNAMPVDRLVEFWLFCKIKQDMGEVLYNCANNFYVRQIFESLPTVEIEVVKNQIVKGVIDFKKIEKNIDLN